MTQTPIRRALVTGGSGDIGGAICRGLGAQGVHVIVHANGNLARAESVHLPLSSRAQRGTCFERFTGTANRRSLAALGMT